MPRINLTYAQLDLKMIDDDRWMYKCSESQQLLYIKLILLAGRLRNKIPSDFEFLAGRLNYKGSSEQFRKDLAHIMGVFPTLTGRPNFFYFKTFWNRYSYIRPKLLKQAKGGTGRAKGLPKSKVGQVLGNANIREEKGIELKGSKPPLLISPYSRLVDMFNKQVCSSVPRATVLKNFEDYKKRGGDMALLEQAIMRQDFMRGRTSWDFIRALEEKVNPTTPKGMEGKLRCPECDGVGHFDFQGTNEPCRKCGERGWVWDTSRMEKAYCV